MYCYLISFLSVFGVPECPPDTQSHGGAIVDHVSFVDTIRADGYTVEVLGDVEQPFLSVKGTRLGVRGKEFGSAVEVHSFAYANAAAAKADAATIEPDGNPKGSKIFWVEPPHYYLRGRVLVIYVGRDAKMMALLGRLLGPPFAEQKM
jgi:hypothetical protein